MTWPEPNVTGRVVHVTAKIPPKLYQNKSQAGSLRAVGTGCDPDKPPPASHPTQIYEGLCRTSARHASFDYKIAKILFFCTVFTPPPV
jgi:hypothetical protein